MVQQLQSAFTDVLNDQAVQERWHPGRPDAGKAGFIYIFLPSREAWIHQKLELKATPPLPKKFLSQFLKHKIQNEDLGEKIKKWKGKRRKIA